MRPRNNSVTATSVTQTVGTVQPPCGHVLLVRGQSVTRTTYSIGR